MASKKKEAAIQSAPSRMEWLRERQRGIGSSDAAMILGVSDWGTALDVYVSKTKEIVEEGAPSEAMHFGNMLEPIIANEFTLRTGRPLVEWPMVENKERPHILATLDRVTADAKHDIVECKAPGAWTHKLWGAEGTDDIPEAYIIQVTHQMLAFDRDSAEVAALIGGQTFRIYKVNRNARLVKAIIDAEDKFWECVVSRRPPVVDPSGPGVRDALISIYGATDTTVELGTMADIAIHMHDRALALETAAKKRKESAKATLAQMLEGAGIGKTPNGRVVTQKVVKKGPYAVGPTEYVDLRVKKSKEEKEDGKTEKKRIAV